MLATTTAVTKSHMEARVVRPKTLTTVRTEKHEKGGMDGGTCHVVVQMLLHDEISPFVLFATDDLCSSLVGG